MTSCSPTCPRDFNADREAATTPVHKSAEERFLHNLRFRRERGFGLTWFDVSIVAVNVGCPRRARWVNVAPALVAAVTALVAREDSVPDRRVFLGFGAERFRTALTRACTVTGVPHLSPHDLRHRRVSLLHLGGMPWARIGELVGHDDLVTTARTYTHVVLDECEVDHEEALVK